jgi:hypothetical protein
VTRLSVIAACCSMALQRRNGSDSAAVCRSLLDAALIAVGLPLASYLTGETRPPTLPRAICAVIGRAVYGDVIVQIPTKPPWHTEIIAPCGKIMVICAVLRAVNSG